MESVKKAKQRLGLYPTWIASCSPEATVYAKCVAKYMGGVSKGQCEAEFVAFRQCVSKAATKMGKKL